MSEPKFKVGQVWRAKRPSNANGFVNDRSIRWIGSMGQIQYDGPAVARGRHYPKVDAAVFEKWAGREVTDELPAEEWAQWDWKDSSKNK